MDVEQRAREILAAEWRKRIDFGAPDSFATYMVEVIENGGMDNSPDMRAIIAALTPPEGFVLVPKEPTSAMQDAVESMKLPHALLRTGVRLADFRERYAAMLAASSEVKL